MVKTLKFSQFLQGGIPGVGDRPVGLGAATQYNTIWDGFPGGSGGAVTQVIIQDNTFSKGQWVRFDVATNEYVLAKADTPQNAEVIGVVIDVQPPGGPYTQFTLQQSGYILASQQIFGPLTPGEPQFLSDAVAGAMLNTDVLVDGRVSRPVFIPDKNVSGWMSGWVLPYRGIIAGGGPDTGTPGTTTPTDSNIITVVQNGHGLNEGDWIRVESPQAGPQVRYVKAVADNIADSQSVGVVIQRIDANTFRMQFAGYVATDVTTSTTAPYQAYDSLHNLIALVPKTVYYLSPTDPGFIVNFDPATIGMPSKPLFISEQTSGTVNTNAGWILPQRPLQASTVENPIRRTITQPGHGFTMIGTVVKTSTLADGQYVACDATNIIRATAVGMIVEIPDIDHFTVQEVGYVTGLNVAPPVPGGIANTASPFTRGLPYYLKSTAGTGELTAIPPASPNYQKPQFEPDGQGSGWILPMKPTSPSNAGTGAFVLINSYDMTNLDELDLPNIFAAYTDVKIVGRNLIFQTIASPTTLQAQNFRMQWYYNGILETSAYYVSNINRNTGILPAAQSSVFFYGDQFAGVPTTTLSTKNGQCYAFEVEIYGIQDLITFKQAIINMQSWQVYNQLNYNISNNNLAMHYNNLLNISGIKFSFLAPGLYRITHGTISVYGILA